MSHKKVYAYDHKPIPFEFSQSVERFFVEEIPLYRFSGNGNYIVFKIKKRDMSTWKLVHVLAKSTGLKERDIGYAGLKDKSATAIQYISIPKKYEKEVDHNLTTERVEILERFYNNAPIKIGHLKANRFSIVLRDLKKGDASRFDKAAQTIGRGGMPNYFGYQRFGEDGKSFLQGKKIAASGKRLKGAKEKLLVSAWQSHLFNEWLGERINISKTVSSRSVKDAASILGYPTELVEVLKKEPSFFKIFLGDVMMPYPFGKPYYANDMVKEAEHLAKRSASPTGILCGDRAMRARSDARHLEEAFDDSELSSLRGDRRFAWVWPEDVSTDYDAATQTMVLNFTLPKGSYATTFLEEIGKRTLR